MEIYYQEKEKDFFLFRMAWVILGLILILLGFFLLFFTITLKQINPGSILLTFLIILGFYCLIRGFYDIPMKVTNFEIIFSNPRVKRIPIIDIEALGWLASGREPKQFLIVITKSGKYIVGRRNSRHVQQTVSDIENLADALSLVTKKPIQRANQNWLKSKWIEKNLLKLKEKMIENIEG